MHFHDDTLFNEAYLSTSLNFDREIKERSLSPWLNTTIWQQSQVGYTQCASFWPQIHYSWAPHEESPTLEYPTSNGSWDPLTLKAYVWAETWSMSLVWARGLGNQNMDEKLKFSLNIWKKNFSNGARGVWILYSPKFYISPDTLKKGVYTTECIAHYEAVLSSRVSRVYHRVK